MTRTIKKYCIAAFVVSMYCGLVYVQCYAAFNKSPRHNVKNEEAICVNTSLR